MNDGGIKTAFPISMFQLLIEYSVFSSIDYQKTIILAISETMTVLLLLFMNDINDDNYVSEETFGWL